MKVIFADQNNIFVVRYGETSNDKISNGLPLVQTYTFSRAQYEWAIGRKGKGMKEFFALDHTNCLDCPFSGNQGAGGCYTHKFNQYVGFLSMLRSITPEDLGPLDQDKRNDIVSFCRGNYVRFGTYGEPSLLPFDLVQDMTAAASSWTGYTHQWAKGWAVPYREYFMASVHDAQGQHAAQLKGYRSFIASVVGTETAVGCPASKEGGYRSNCAVCGLCSGVQGKGRKDVKILVH